MNKLSPRTNASGNRRSIDVACATSAVAAAPVADVSSVTGTAPVADVSSVTGTAAVAAAPVADVSSVTGTAAVAAAPVADVSSVTGTAAVAADDLGVFGHVDVAVDSAVRCRFGVVWIFVLEVASRFRLPVGLSAAGSSSGVAPGSFII